MPYSRNGGRISGITQTISDALYDAYERRLLAEVKSGRIPAHIAVIMDGNRRFAYELGLESVIRGSGEEYAAGAV
jgi:undecaprenyl pyrophosphate synthase